MTSNETPKLTFVSGPTQLPEAPKTGRLVAIDLAFAAGDDFARTTKPCLDALGDRLAAWIDHHDHDAWKGLENDDRFVLVSKLDARACPQLVTPELAERIGPIDHVWAHGDFDGLIAAVKLLRGGAPPYPEADEDARFTDAPGKGFVCTARGERYVLALDRLQGHEKWVERRELLEGLAEALVSGEESPELTSKIDELRDAYLQHRETLLPLLDGTTRPHPEVVVLETKALQSADRKFLLRLMEDQATVAVIHEPGWSTLGTFQDEDLDLSSLPGLKGGRGYAFGKASKSELAHALASLLDGREG